jgi:hypothetical protein
MFSIHLTKLAMNVSQFHVSCIQETDYGQHFTCSGLIDFLNIINTGRCVNWFDYLQIVSVPSRRPTKSASMCTIVTAVLQQQYLQTELILWIHLVDTQPVMLVWTLDAQVKTL